MKQKPKIDKDWFDARIYVHSPDCKCDDCYNDCMGHVTWGSERVSKDDMVYVRADIHKKAMNEIKRLKEIIKTMEEQP